MIRTYAERLFEGGTRSLVLPGPLVAMLVAASLLFAGPTHAATTFTVNSTSDPGDGDCTVTGCTLREAIAAANEAPGADTIDFDIPGSGVKTISPVAPPGVSDAGLPEITEAVTIDGYSQPGASPNTRKTGALDADILVELSGINAGESASGLIISAPNVVVRGLVINRFAGAGIFMISGTGSRIEGNFIGTDPSGTLGRSNSESVDIEGVGGKNTIGGLTPDKRNLISGNNSSAVEIQGKGANKVQGNLIGVQRDGISPLTNSLSGVSVESDDNVVGGGTPEAANTIAFNARAGVAIEDVDSSGNRILGNSVFSNGGPGIDLAFGGREQDPRDPDLGPNNFQNFPEIASADKVTSGTTTVRATLDSTPSAARKKRTFTIQFFANPHNDSSDLDEGKTFLGQTRVTTNRQGKASFSFQTGKPVALGDRITATATGKGGTSEFSDPVVVKLAPGQG
jgi:CSLREA domain-containing protein